MNEPHHQQARSLPALAIGILLVLSGCGGDTDVRDNDGDKLMNADELLYGTDPDLADTDGDGLDDYQEVRVYFTYPLNPNSDGDCVNDGDEVAAGTDPMVADACSTSGLPSVAQVTLAALAYGEAPVCSYSGYADPEGDPDQSSYGWVVNDVDANIGAQTLYLELKPYDKVACYVTPFDGTDTGAVVSSGAQHYPCPGASAVDTTVCALVDTTNTYPVADHLSGFNVQFFYDGWQPWDKRLVERARLLHPGVLRFVSGYAYDWHSGDIPEDRAIQFYDQDKPKKYDKYVGYRKTISGKGYIKIHDFAVLAQRVGARLNIVINTMTDDVDSAAGLAAYVVEQGYDIAFWELGSETFYWGDSLSLVQFFNGGYGYAFDMLNYYDAIQGAYTNAGLIAPPIILSTSDGGETGRQLRFDGMDLKDGYDPATDELGIAGYGSSHDPVSTHQKYWDSWGHHWYSGHTAYRLEDGSDVDVEVDENAHFPIFQAVVNHRIVNSATQRLDDYFLPLHGSPDFDDAPRDGMAAYITEHNLRYTTPWTKTAFSAIYASENTLRWSAHPRVKNLNYHALTGQCINARDSHRQTAISAGNQNRIKDTVDNDYGLYWAMPCLALQLTNRAVNTADVRLDTTLLGGVTVDGREASQGETDSKWHPGEIEQVAAIYSQTYSDRDGVERMILTNRSPASHDVTIIKNGERLAGPLAVSTIQGAEARTLNDQSVDDALHQTLEYSSQQNPVTLPPWSVVMVEWAHELPAGAPSAPQALNAVPGERQLALTWSPVAGATAYRVKWGVSEGAYLNMEEVTGTQYTIDSYHHDIDLHVSVSAVNTEGEGSNSAEVVAQTLPVYQVNEGFTSGDLSNWQRGCGSSDAWSSVDGVLELAYVGSGRSCLLHTGTVNKQRQVVTSRFKIADWATGTNDTPRVGVVGGYDTFGADGYAYLQGYLDKEKGFARIMYVKKESETDTVTSEVWARSEDLDDVHPQLDMSAMQDQWVTLSLEIDGRTTRLWLGEGEGRRIIAAAIDESSVLQLGMAGVVAKKQAVKFDYVVVE